MEPFGKVTPHYLAKVYQEFLSGCCGSCYFLCYGLCGSGLLFLFYFEVVFSSRVSCCGCFHFQSRLDVVHPCLVNLAFLVYQSFCLLCCIWPLYFTFHSSITYLLYTVSLVNLPDFFFFFLPCRFSGFEKQCQTTTLPFCSVAHLRPFHFWRTL